MMCDRKDDSLPPSYYPICLDLRQQPCLVVGGGNVALRKVEGLLTADALVTVISPQVLTMPPSVTVLLREVTDDDIRHVTLVIAATDHHQLNAHIAEVARLRGILVNVVDAPQYCSFILPAVVRQGALQIAISTGGASPTLARKLRHELTQAYGPEYGLLVNLLWQLRRKWEPCMDAIGLPHHQRRYLWENVLQLPLLQVLRSDTISMAEQLAQSLFDETICEVDQRQDC
ncbi:MAG TPA: bifunctional precorrin-2 dehydrogenase/sirohydrochlorin ferrochelatase [Armatimonadota bacterium]|nr:bifunctional precorrin-2 dehydrogenase/sirohydrochlorin ferrochelatase [Armatimonadota bacterium]